MFPVNQELIDRARDILRNHEIYWIIGASCVGKSTLCREIASTKKIALYDMDEHIFDRYISLYRKERHPASKARFSAENPLAWVLSLSCAEFDALSRAENVEYLDLLASELSKEAKRQPLLIDGGITHPSILVQAISPRHIVCIETTEEARVQTWEHSTDRAMMKRWIWALPNPDEMWEKFLCLDELIAQTIARESGANNIKTISRDEKRSVEELTSVVVSYLGL